MPLYFDEDVVERLCEVVLKETESQFRAVRIILVDDGSLDGTYLQSLKLHHLDSRIQLIRLASNFGQHKAILAGLSYSTGDLVVVMDSDLQDRPSDIIRLAEKMIEDDTMMCISRRQSRADSLLKRFWSRVFQLVSNLLVPFKVEPRLGGFRIMRNELVKCLNDTNETTGLPFSLLSSLNVPYSVVDVKRDVRVAGKSGYNFRKSLKLASDRIITYSGKPIRSAIFLGISLGLGSLLIASYVLINFSIHDKIIPGWTSLAFMISFFAGLNLIFLGILGEYVNRIYIEARGVPPFVIRSSTLGENMEDE